jgi:L-alanine-DL-glutamate epimerase-like enolase superfamily enzyme
MKITAVEAIPYAIPYRRPLHFASGEIHAAEHVLVRVHTDDGVVGTVANPVAKAALDMAIWDALGRTVDAGCRGVPRAARHGRSR